MALMSVYGRRWLGIGVVLMWDGLQVPLISFLLPISLFDYFLKQQ